MAPGLLAKMGECNVQHNNITALLAIACSTCFQRPHHALCNSQKGSVHVKLAVPTLIRTKIASMPILMGNQSMLNLAVLQESWINVHTNRSSWGIRACGASPCPHQPGCRFAGRPILMGIRCMQNHMMHNTIICRLIALSGPMKHDRSISAS